MERNAPVIGTGAHRYGHCAALGCSGPGNAVHGVGASPLHRLARLLTLDLDPPIAATHRLRRACGRHATPAAAR
jgi:hypothetical protein